MSMKKLIIRDVRVFSDVQEFEIRPLTFITGENSTGKSTVLGCWHALSNWYGSTWYRDMDFNTPPYSMGSFDNIARRTRSRDRDFMIGFEVDHGKMDGIYRYEVTLNKEGSEPRARHEAHIWRGADGDVLSHEEEIKEHRFHPPSYTIERVFRDVKEEEDEPDKEKKKYRKEDVEIIYKMAEKINWKVASTFGDYVHSESIAPLRSEPRRTYDPMRGADKSQGDDMPMMLRDIKRGHEKEWAVLRKSLVDFGQRSKMFDDITVRSFGKSDSEPFQIQVNKGGNANLIDVGYGVSQILPILVKIFQARMGALLIQQPEVHLHPRGQAELSSLLVNAASGKHAIFAVETHSDYMIDRARIEVRRGVISPEDVSIIFLESKRRGVKVHNLQLDHQGDFIKTPRGYRDFFLKEIDNLLGIPGE